MNTISDKELNLIAGSVASTSLEQYLALELLALRKEREAAVPVAWLVHERTGNRLTQDGDYVANAEGIASIHSTPLYAAPPAQPVAVPDEIPKISDGKVFKYVKDGIRYSSNYANGWNACRAAMLAAAPGKEG